VRQTVQAVRGWLRDQTKDLAILAVTATIVVVLITVIGWGAMEVTRTMLGWLILSSLTNAVIVAFGIEVAVRLYFLKETPIMQGRPKSHFVQAGAIQVIPRVISMGFLALGVFMGVQVLLKPTGL
jgi:hypothetical protein